MNEQNLIPNSRRSREELQEMGRKGGIKSGEVRRHNRELRKLARSIQKGRPAQLSITMPLTRGMFLRAANRYWLSRGAQFGNAQAQMASMDIEGS